MTRRAIKAREREVDRAWVRWENCRDKVRQREQPNAMQLALRRARADADRCRGGGR